jgi:hypothetical protein
MHVPRLPLIFVACLSTPSPESSILDTTSLRQDQSVLTTPWFLLKHYTRSALALLRVRTFVVPSGRSITEEVVAKVRHEEYHALMLVSPDFTTVPSDIL